MKGGWNKPLQTKLSKCVYANVKVVVSRPMVHFKMLIICTRAETDIQIHRMFESTIYPAVSDLTPFRIVAKFKQLCNIFFLY